tara:strand:+ start:60 stop:416 length:357 start_codon:yes stop_codon:yes gene_type:complete
METTNDLYLLDENEPFKEHKQVALKDVVKECPELIRGKVDLFNETVEPKCSQEQMNLWLHTLKIAQPHMDEMLLKQLVDTYARHPDIVKKLCDEHRAGADFSHRCNTDWRSDKNYTPI